MTQPLLSIVIANYNYGRFLGEAIESVLSQLDFSSNDQPQKLDTSTLRLRLPTSTQNTVPSNLVELIICDGGSTDNSVEVIKRYAAGLPPNLEKSDPSTVHLHLLPSPISYWCSEPDGGQSAAFNKGFSHAHGRFLTWLNADDVMLPGTIVKLRRATEKWPEQEWFVGGVLWLDPTMHIINCGRGRPFSEMRYHEGDVSVWGPSSFFSRRLLDSVDGVDERFYYTMDTDLWLRFARIGVRYRPFCDYAYGLRLHPDAKMSGQNFGDDEAKRIHAQKVAREKTLSTEGFSIKHSTCLRRLLSASWCQVLSAKKDLMRWHGKSYLEVFK